MNYSSDSYIGRDYFSFFFRKVLEVCSSSNFLFLVLSFDFFLNSVSFFLSSPISFVKRKVKSTIEQ